MRNELTSLGGRELVERIRFGETTAENEFVRRYSNPLRAMMFARTRNHDDAEDLVQDTLLAVLQALRRGALVSSERLDAFVHGTARNVANNYLRALQRHPPEVPLSEDVPAGPVEPEWESAERLALVIAIARIFPALARGSSVPTPLTRSCTSPDTSAVMAGGAPLKLTRTTWMPAIVLSISVASIVGLEVAP